MKFIPMLMVAGALLASATTVSAQTRVNLNRSADQLNSQVLDMLRGPQAAVPVVATTSVGVTPVAPTASTSALSGVYVGANMGHTFRDATEWQLGGMMGYQFHRNWAAEITYDFNRRDHGVNGQNVMANLVYSRPLTFAGVTPYVLVGTGVGWNASGERGTGDHVALYNVGGGVRVNILRNLDLDARYRYVGAFEQDVTGNTHMATLGAVWRF